MQEQNQEVKTTEEKINLAPELSNAIVNYTLQEQYPEAIKSINTNLKVAGLVQKYYDSLPKAPQGSDLFSIVIEHLTRKDATLYKDSSITVNSHLKNELYDYGNRVLTFLEETPKKSDLETEEFLLAEASTLIQKTLDKAQQVLIQKENKNK